jgi:hypothetical protein
MRYIALILFAGVALSSIPASAAVKDDASQHAVVVAYGCPVYEGYPDCHPDADSAGSAHSGRSSHTRS